jgi:monofunctional glycosyltransferase
LYRLVRGALKLLVILVVAVLVLPAVGVILYRFVPPPVTPLMLIRRAEGFGLSKAWRDRREISPYLFRAVVASEDAKFCSHHGFDWDSMADAWDAYQDGRRVRGASTITMQTAKNLFLWPGRDFLRKGIEAYITVLIEALWSKARILEVYANIVEWGPGLYGAEAAARHWFGKPARLLTAREAARLAVVLPNPRRWSPAAPTPYIARRTDDILERMQSDRRGNDDFCRTAFAG